MPTTRRRLPRLAGVALLLGLGPWWILAWGLDRAGRQTLPEGSWDAIVVAGCRVEAPGVPSPALRRRTEKAVELYRRGAAPVLLFTGGLGRFPPTEAQAAAAHALELGVPPDAILLEDRSTSTEENARFAAEDHGYRRILLVTDSYHVFRASRVFARYFDEVEGAGSLAPAWPRVRGSLREVLAVGWYGLRGRI